MPAEDPYKTAQTSGLRALLRDGRHGIKPWIEDDLVYVERYFVLVGWGFLSGPLLMGMWAGANHILRVLLVAALIVARNLIGLWINKRPHLLFREGVWLSVRMMEIATVGFGLTLAHQLVTRPDYNGLYAIPVLYSAMIGGFKRSLWVQAAAVGAIFLSGAWLLSMGTVYLSWKGLLLSAASWGVFNLVLAFVGIILAGAVQRERVTAFTDPLTGLANRRHFTNRMTKLLESGSRQEVAILIVDLDDFKQVNDTYGHPAGDRVLQAVARVVRESAEGEVTGRYGGEEFVVLAPGGVTQAARIARRIQSDLQANPVQVTEEKTVWMTASIGVAYQTADRPAAHLLEAADQALYAAKAAGKNRIQLRAVRSESSGGQPCTQPLSTLARCARLIRAAAYGIGIRENMDWNGVELAMAWSRGLLLVLLPLFWLWGGAAVLGSLYALALTATLELALLWWLIRKERPGLDQSLWLRTVNILSTGVVLALVHKPLNANTYNALLILPTVLAAITTGHRGLLVATALSAAVLYGVSVFLDQSLWISLGALANLLFSVATQFLAGMLTLLLAGMVIESRQEAHTDPLTGLLSRRAALSHLQRILDARKEVTVIIADIDSFKSINDQWGHLTGDQVLIHVTRIMSAEARPGHCVGRLGGEEFILISENALPSSEAWAERVRQRLATEAITGAEVPAPPSLRPSLSFGLTCGAPGDTVPTLLTRADQALYQAKQAGKDRLVVGH